MIFEQKVDSKRPAEARILLFDLDGTLTDSGEGISRSVQYALKKCGIDEADFTKLRRFVGPPLLWSFEHFYGMEPSKAEEAVRYYRERYAPIGIYENRVYKGIPEMLRALKAEGKCLVTASSKPEVFVRRVLSSLVILDCFDEIVGASMDGQLSEKADIIREVLRRLSITEEKKAGMLMIGDRQFDIEGAKAVGVRSVGVLYGYAEPGELKEAGADYIAATVSDLRALLSKGK